MTMDGPPGTPGNMDMHIGAGVGRGNGSPRVAREERREMEDLTPCIGFVVLPDTPSPPSTPTSASNPASACFYPPTKHHSTITPLPPLTCIPKAIYHHIRTCTHTHGPGSMCFHCKQAASSPCSRVGASVLELACPLKRAHCAGSAIACVAWTLSSYGGWNECNGGDECSVAGGDGAGTECFNDGFTGDIEG